MASRSVARSASTVPRRSLSFGADPEVHTVVSSYRLGATATHSVKPPSKSLRSQTQSCLACTAVRHFPDTQSSSMKQSRPQHLLCAVPVHGRNVVRQKFSAHNLRRCTGKRNQIKCQRHPELEKLGNITVPGVNGSPDVAAFAARPAKARPGKLPVVLMIHEFYGLTDDIIGKAQALAEELGALVIAPDTYRGDWTKFIPKAIFLALTTPQLTDVDALARLKGPVLLIYGDRDAQFPPAKVHAFRDALVKAGVKVKHSMYAGQGHAFFRNMAQVEADDGPQRQAWTELVAFLRETLLSKNQ